MLTINLHRRTTDNIGDVVSAPSQYFPNIATRTADLLGFKAHESGDITAAEWIEQCAAADHFVVGGGGLLGLDFFREGFDCLFQNKKPEATVTLWGAGYNDGFLTDWRNLKPSMGDLGYPFDLVGVRDFGCGHDWVPCVSCMNPIFDSAPAPTHEVVLYAHHDTLRYPHLAGSLPSGLPVLSNTAPLDEAVAFLASGDLVLTDSYHGAYWATLLGRRVVAFPNSSKFYTLKHAVPLCHPTDWLRYEPLAKRYPMALMECREVNRTFAQRVGEMIAA